MSSWDKQILGTEANTTFLDDLTLMDTGDQIEALQDACELVLSQGFGDPEESDNGLAAATIAAIWSGAPYTAAEIVDEFPFIRSGIGQCPEQLAELAGKVFEQYSMGLDEDTLDAIEGFAEAVS